MEQRQLANTGMTVSRACLGTMTFGSQVDARTAAAMLDLCQERGINFIDTANAYNLGESERMLGSLLAGRREKFILATKVFNKMGEGPDERGLSRAAIAKAIDDSLRRLNTDYVDLYYLHQPDYNVRIGETLEAMDRLVQAGKVRHVGASNYAAWQVVQMLNLAERNGWRGVSVMQPMYNVLARGIEAEFLPMCREYGLAVVPYNPLAGGMLTGKHRPGTPSEGTRFQRMPFYQDRYWHDANFAAVNELHAAAKAAGRTLISLALNWLLHHTATDSIILGASSLEQLKQNLAALDDGPLSAETLEACDSVWRQVRGVVPQYNR